MALREPIYAALFDLLANNASIKATFVTVERVLVPETELNVSAMPAIFQIQTGEHRVKGPPKGISVKRTLQAEWIVYAAARPNEAPPSTILNNVMDVVDVLIEYPGNPANTQTLGGLVEHVFLEGEINIAEGQLASGANGSIMVVPLTILIP